MASWLAVRSPVMGRGSRMTFPSPPASADGVLPDNSLEKNIKEKKKGVGRVVILPRSVHIVAQLTQLSCSDRRLKRHGLPNLDNSLRSLWWHLLD